MKLLICRLFGHKWLPIFRWRERSDRLPCTGAYMAMISVGWAIPTSGGYWSNQSRHKCKRCEVRK